MRLPDYIKSIGDAAAAQKWGVRPRTVASWRRGERLPRAEQARQIVNSSPVTYAGIYGESAELAEPNTAPEGKPEAETAQATGIAQLHPLPDVEAGCQGAA